jgi:hypothetical protein
MVVGEDPVRLSQTDTQRMLLRSCQTWSFYANEANSDDFLQPGCIQLWNVLTRVPAFLANGVTNGHEISPFKLTHCGSKGNDYALYINGRSMWRISEGECDLKKKVIHDKLLLGFQRSIRFTYVDDFRFANWPGVQGERESPVKGNCLAIL